MTSPGALFDMTGKVAIVTGGASGIGEATAQVLAGAGAHVVVADIDGDGAERVAKAIGEQASAGPCDVRRREDVFDLVDGTVTEHGRLDVMFNNAGASFTALVPDIDEDLLDAAIALNLKGVLWGCQAALAAMKDGGAIVNASSTSIDVNALGNGAYAMTKAAVAQLTQTLAMEAGPLGVRVNAIAPGFTDTNFYAEKKREARPGEPPIATYDGVLQLIREQSPLEMVGEAIDQAALVLYLVSDAGRFTTGQILRSNGGIAMPW